MLSATTVVVVLPAGGVALADVLVAIQSNPHRNGKAAHRTIRISVTLLSTVLEQVSVWSQRQYWANRLQSTPQTSCSAQRHRVRRLGSSRVRGAGGVDCPRLMPFRTYLDVRHQNADSITVT